jgi:tRNA (guanine26-N2/guanine27-N2)-dimethyltransferase
MSFVFPAETVKEGKATITVPKLKTFAAESQEYVPSKAPVFYNPRMEINRDLAVLVLQTHQRMLNREVTACEPLTGCGVRGIRLANEVEGISKVVINDISPEAAQLAQHNVQKNKASKKIEVCNEDANLFLSRYAAPRKRFDYVDIDPFGSPAPYMDAAVRAVRNGGILALTATDMAPLCGVHPKACVRKYGGKPLRTEYCHELALRLLIGSAAMTAAKHDIGLHVLFSYCAHNYVRTYALLNYGAKEADKSVKAMGYVMHCFACFHRETVEGLVPFFERKCPECGSKLQAAGPLWLGQLWNKQFCVLMQKEARRSTLRLKEKVQTLLFTVVQEVEAPITYYVVDKLCDKWNLSIPSLSRVINELTKKGFQTVPTHFSSKALRTDAPIETIKELLITLVSSRKSKKTI